MPVAGGWRITALIVHYFIGPRFQWGEESKKAVVFQFQRIRKKAIFRSLKMQYSLNRVIDQWVFVPFSFRTDLNPTLLHCVAGRYRPDFV